MVGELGRECRLRVSTRRADKEACKKKMCAVYKHNISCYETDLFGRLFAVDCVFQVAKKKLQQQLGEG